MQKLINGQSAEIKYLWDAQPQKEPLNQNSSSQN